MDAPNRVVATRRLTYAYKDDSTRRGFTVCISEPYLLTEESVGYEVPESTSGCIVSFDGLPEKEISVVGADTFQALQLAIDAAESYLKRLSKKYDFYFDGDHYFDD